MTKPPVKHGTLWGYYGRGCRCYACTDAARVNRKEARDRARAENRPSYQRELAVSRALKAARRGKCEDCGAETRYNGHKGVPVSRFCVPCGKKRGGEKLAGSGPVQARLYEFLSEPHRFSEIREALGITNNHMSTLIDRDLKAGRIKRLRRGVYQVAP